MSAPSMTLAERVRKLSALAAEAQACRTKAEAATNYEVADDHWDEMNRAMDAILALLASPEAQEALRQLEQLAEASALISNPQAHLRGRDSIPYYGAHYHPGDVA